MISIDPRNYPTVEGRYAAEKAARETEAEELWNRPASQLPYPEADDITVAEVNAILHSRGQRLDWAAIQRGEVVGAFMTLSFWAFCGVGFLHWHSHAPAIKLAVVSMAATASGLALLLAVDYLCARKRHGNLQEHHRPGRSRSPHE